MVWKGTEMQLPHRCIQIVFGTGLNRPRQESIAYRCADESNSAGRVSCPSSAVVLIMKEVNWLRRSFLSWIKIRFLCRLLDSIESICQSFPRYTALRGSLSFRIFNNP